MYTVKVLRSIELDLQMYLADGHFFSFVQRSVWDDIEISSSLSLMNSKGFWPGRKHHNLQMYLAVESLTVAFFSLIDEFKTSLQYLVAALILTSYTF